jgi:very-short-patch-repair endonuclease
MFYNAKSQIFENAKRLRNNMTLAEKKLWECLKGKAMSNFKFRAQHPIDVFIADFYCHKLKLVIEVDGEIHKKPEQREYDIGREEELERLDIKVIRFTNEEIETDIGLVLNTIKDICHERSIQKSPL